ncbi:DUF6597 domain-containing transcriptional factor [Nocardioides sp. R-C-SC26]|uniref:DUF6597 domain-containing transcriptional factor n=1 Tax=Nocardioides sp. R-C-SC26 TaxID=2870414 RepID=UPI001E5A2FEC|nr:DUF6597 domain-containing transcriptional factor [Nocardioides sp. R-C-SC26]
MRARTNATPTSTTAGILRPEQFAAHATVARPSASSDLTEWVENHWLLTWDLPDGATYSSQTLPHPACTISVERGHPRAGVGAERVLVTGVVTRRFDVTLARRGWVYGAKFRPGGFTALTGVPARAVTDRTAPADGLLPSDVRAALATLDGLTHPRPVDEVVAVAEIAMRSFTPDPGDSDYQIVLDVVADMLADRALIRVTEIEERHGISARRLQRLFAHYVGVGPKWVLARYRMHDVVAAIDQGYDGALADLAATFGWFDQAHFGRDFTRLVGMPPSEYRDRGAQPSA